MKKLFLCFILLPLFTSSAAADGISASLADKADIYAVEDSLPEAERDISGELRLDGSYDEKGALKRLWEKLISALKGSIKGELSFFSSILSLIFFCSLAASLCSGDSFYEYINTIGCCTIAYMISGSVEGIVFQAANAVNRLSDYSRAAMPAIFTAAAACGAVGSASVKYAAACLSIEVFMSVARELIIPLIYAYIAVSLSSAIFDNSVLKAVSKICKSGAAYLMTGLCIIFSAYISISGLIAGSADAMAVKTAKTLISGSMPVVGGIISDAASAVLASASLIKNSAGVFSLIAVCALCLSPFAVLSVKALLFKAVSAVAEMLPGGRISALLGSLGSAMSLLLGLVGSCGIMLFISIMSGIRVIGL